MHDHYAGDLSPKAAWNLLEEKENATLFDVRTQAEWQWVGVPDLTKIKKNITFLSWSLPPMMDPNPDFISHVMAEHPDKNTPLIFLCRSGVRSREAAITMTATGYTQCYNLEHGFEGDLDEHAHRGHINGWKHTGLPWLQK